MADALDHAASARAPAVVAMLHPVTEMDALSFGSAAAEDIRHIWAHVAGCQPCRALLLREGELRRRLALLREDEPRIDVLDRVMRQIDADA